MDAKQDPIPLPAPILAPEPQGQIVANAEEAATNGAEETPEQSFALSPVPKGQVEHFRMNSDAEVALEDDEMIELQIQLAQAREQALVRQIESKKRRLTGTIAKLCEKL